MDDAAMAAVAKALAHPARIHILRLLASQSECRGADVFAELPLAQSTVSQHLAALRDAGLVAVHPVGPANVYCLAPQALRLFSAEVASLATDTPTCAKTPEECR